MLTSKQIVSKKSESKVSSGTEEQKIVVALADLQNQLRLYLYDDIVTLVLLCYLKPSKSVMSSSQPRFVFFDASPVSLAKQAAEFFLWGKIDDAISIVETYASIHRTILTCSVKVKGPNGEVEGTFYRAALSTGDEYILDKDGNTAIGRAKTLLIKHCGETEEKIQSEAQFPKTKDRDWEKEEKAKVQADREAFDKVAKAFNESKAETEEELQEDKTLQDAIQDFKNYFLSRGLISSGRDCMHQLWDYAAAFYDYKKYKVYGGYNSPKNNLFCQKILGTIDSRMPAWGMQILDYGICNANTKTDLVPRGSVSSYYVSSSSSTLVLGSNCFMSIFGLVEWFAEPRRFRDGGTFGTFVNKQNHARKSLAAIKLNR